MNKQTFLAKLAPTVVYIHVNALDEAVAFQKFSGKAREDFFSAVKEGDKSTNTFEALIVAATVVGDDGAPMFNQEDIEALRAVDADALTELAVHALSVNKIGVKAEADAAKN